MKKDCHDLEKLALGRLPSKEGDVLASYLSHFPKLKFLSCFALSGALLRALPLTLEMLDMGFHIRKGAWILAEFLQRCSTLKILTISGSKLDAGKELNRKEGEVTALAEGIALCTTLEKIDLSSNWIGDEGGHCSCQSHKTVARFTKFSFF